MFARVGPEGVITVRGHEGAGWGAEAVCEVAVYTTDGIWCRGEEDAKRAAQWGCAARWLRFRRIALRCQFS